MSKKGEISQSVEESNKQRAALGIKPLKEDDKSSKKAAPVEKPGTGDKPTDEEVRKRVGAARTRREHEELTKGKGLGDIIAEEEGTGGASSWIARTRGSDGAMKAPAGAAAAAKKKGDASSSAEVSGLKVAHDASQFEDGETVLTLSDQQILNEDGELNDGPDELSNVGMRDVEKAKHNEAVKNRVEYDPTKEGASLLDKYDELKTGPKGFMIGGHVMGAIDEADPAKRLAIMTKLSEQQSLEPTMKVQSDFYTSAEMAEQELKFNKPKKKIKKRTRQADAKDDASAPAGMGKAMPGHVADAGSDEEDPELYEQLTKQRRLVRRSDAGAVKKGESALETVTERVSSLKGKDEDMAAAEEPGASASASGSTDAVSMTATTEFCNVVQTPLEKMDTIKHESFRGSALYKQQAATRRAKASRLGAKAAAALAGDDEPAAKGDEDEVPIMEEQLDLSCSSGLAYLRARAQMGIDQESHMNRKSDNRPLEMSTVDGDIKLEYRDDFGRVQTPKEAFRAISWKFHGKTPGRKNMERRLIRLENEMKLKSMDPVAQLPTLRALRHVQQGEAKPYMVLSGANEK
mmetsp:Transcript_46616/g.110854  ORF Transcript_46616/g.110854 Transcript_46616/m.110854 type:complete len:576 (-) Transcript_46616:137-1864(-)|eukprot:CAMPEP_0178440248 /NCGR_PEP_ID=MMETSP0689_2-20121128/36653_1 /TAXON_ID=160604 /ORGANISM="Amphidinium massartii, Strain CS-259" /LENGTH=575 /DNA_ID=CAMNT_0020062961 /DNA_START=42 /DNA_END=1769 /DNA_ORIENTATION=-